MVNFFHHYEDDPSLRVGRTAAVVICVVFDILLVTRSTQVDPSIMSLVCHARNRESIVHIILVEIWNDLDAYGQGSSTFFRGSSLLLYMWLLEHFRSVGFNSTRLSNPTHFFHRPTINGLTSLRLIGQFGSRRTFARSDGTFPDGSMVLKVKDQNYVLLRGLWYTSFYLPGHLIRHFNISQDIPLVFNDLSPWINFVTPSVSLTVERMCGG